MENYITTGTTKIWTAISSTDKDQYIIWCNGGPGTCDYLLPVSQMVDDHYNVIRFEPRGCGRSDRDGNYDLATVIADLETIRAYYNNSSWVIGGHSWGANLALIYAIEHPGVTDAFLYIAGSGVQNDRGWSAAYHDNREKRGEITPEMPFPGNDEVNKAGNTSFRTYIQRPSLYKAIAGLKMPALFMCAGDDIRPNWPTEQIQAVVEKSRLVTIPGATHYIWLTHDMEMKNELRKFLGLNA